MIKCNLAVLMAERGLKIQDIADRTKLSRTTVAALYHNTSKGIQFDTMDSLCKLLKITPGELFSYEPISYSFTIIEAKPSKDKNNYLTMTAEAQIKYKNENICETFPLEIDVGIDSNEEERIEYLGITPSYPPVILDISKQIPKMFWTGVEQELANSIMDYMIKSDEFTESPAIAFY